MSLVNELVIIHLQDIISATNNFSDNNCIGKGGFGNVYKGKLLYLGQQVMVAVKRLDRRFGQGDLEFWKEIMMLSCYKHENIISLLGFCDEGEENILVYEYLPNKSLDEYLNDNKLSWIDRLHICVGAACGLEYLHNPHGTMQMVLHRDIKSANILLDANWNAKISDFGLSKFRHADQEFTYLITERVGTKGYCDPAYAEEGILTKESDIYSFGVVLFEVLCGRRANDGRILLSKLAQNCYEEKKMVTIVPDGLRNQISPFCLDTFSALAYQCLRRDRNERPQIAEIVKQLTVILHHQIASDIWNGKKVKSPALFNLIKNPKTKIFVGKRWSDFKKLKSFVQSYT